MSPNPRRDNSLLAKLAAIQLLSGCGAVPSRHVLAEKRHSVDLDTDDSPGLPKLTLHVVTKLIVQAQHKPAVAAPASCSLHPASEVGVDGHFSTAPRGSCTRSPSEELDRRLGSIDERLVQGTRGNASRRLRLHTSEVSPKVPASNFQSAGSRQNPDDAADANIQDSVNKTMDEITSKTTHAQPHYDWMFPGDRPRRYSSMYMSSAESSPLLTTPVSSGGQIPQVRADPLTAASHVPATTELDELIQRVQQQLGINRLPDLVPAMPCSKQSSYQTALFDVLNPSDSGIAALYDRKRHDRLSEICASDDFCEVTEEASREASTSAWTRLPNGCSLQ